MAENQDPADHLSPRVGYRLINDLTDALGRITARAPAVSAPPTPNPTSKPSRQARIPANARLHQFRCKDSSPILDTFSLANPIEFPILCKTLLSTTAGDDE